MAFHRLHIRRLRIHDGRSESPIRPNVNACALTEQSPPFMCFGHGGSHPAGVRWTKRDSLPHVCIPIAKRTITLEGRCVRSETRAFLKGRRYRLDATSLLLRLRLQTLNWASVFSSTSTAWCLTSVQITCGTNASLSRKAKVDNKVAADQPGHAFVVSSEVHSRSDLEQKIEVLNRRMRSHLRTLDCDFDSRRHAEIVLVMRSISVIN